MKSFVKKAIRSNYYLWLCLALHRRASATFKAIYSGIKKNNKSRKNVFNLRRDVHRIEKGLSFTNRRSVFAEDYIKVVIDRLHTSIESGTCDVKTKSWAIAVLNEYFAKVTHEGRIKSAYNKFRDLSLSNIEPKQIPYNSSERTFSDVTYEQFLALTKQRRSVRFFDEKKVESSVVKKAVAAAMQSPSACNRQSFQFRFCNESKIVNTISKIPGGVSGYRVPSIIVVTAKYEGYFEERDMFAPYIDASLSVMSFILALETLGLSSVVINWSQNPVLDNEIRSLIKLQDDECVVMLVGVGYPDPLGKIPFSAKRSKENVFKQI